MVEPRPSSAASASHWIPGGAPRGGDDPIFALAAAAARAKAQGRDVIDATVGALIDDQGRLCVLPVLAESLARVDPRRAASYAPIAGDAEFRSAVIRDLFGASELAARALAIATPGGSGALHLAIVEFLAPGDALLTTDWHWSPYRTFAEHTGRRVETFRMFDADGRFDAAELERALRAQLARQGRSLVVLNTPCHNPTGYALDARDWEALERVLFEAATAGAVTLCLDHAYARFAPDETCDWTPNVARLVERVPVLVAWTASKAFAQYGARVGALVAVHPQAIVRAEWFDAFSFACRGTWSNCNHLGMLAITAVLESAELRARAERERESLRALLFERVRAFNAAASSASLRYPRCEGGFFVAVFCRAPDAVAARMRELGVYVVPLEHGLRIALCSTAARDVPRLVDALAQSLSDGPRS